MTAFHSGWLQEGSQQGYWQKIPVWGMGNLRYTFI
jgi:hypothetical protein